MVINDAIGLTGEQMIGSFARSEKLIFLVYETAMFINTFQILHCRGLLKKSIRNSYVKNDLVQLLLLGNE